MSRTVGLTLRENEISGKFLRGVNAYEDLINIGIKTLIFARVLMEVRNLKMSLYYRYVPPQFNTLALCSFYASCQINKRLYE